MKQIKKLFKLLFIKISILVCPTSICLIIIIIIINGDDFLRFINFYYMVSSFLFIYLFFYYLGRFTQLIAHLAQKTKKILKKLNKIHDIKLDFNLIFS